MTATITTAEGWVTWASAHGVPAAAVADLPAHLAPCHEVMNASPGEIPSLTAKLGQLLAWLHDRPVADAPGQVLTPGAALRRLDDAIVAAAALEAPLLRALRYRLAADVPDAGRPVACHGDFTPVTVHVDPADHHQVVLTGWGEAVLADREYDLAFSELGLWASAYLSPDEEVRTMLSLARSFLRNGFLAGYRAVADDIDQGRLRWWGGYHVCRLLATPLLAEQPFRDWPTATAAPVVAAFRADLHQRFDQLIPSTPDEGGDPR